MLIPASSRRRSPGRRHGEEWPSGPEPRVTRARRRSRRKRRCSARSRVRCPGRRGCWADVLASPAAQPPAVLRGGGGTSARVEHGPGQAAASGGHRRFLSGANPRIGPRVAAADRPSQRPSGTRRTAGVAGASPPELRPAAQPLDGGMPLSASETKESQQACPPRQAGLGIPPAAAMHSEVLGHGRAVRSGTGPRQKPGPGQDRAGAAAGDVMLGDSDSAG